MKQWLQQGDEEGLSVVNVSTTTIIGILTFCFCLSWSSARWPEENRLERIDGSKGMERKLMELEREDTR
jgi:hypothetical protein